MLDVISIHKFCIMQTCYQFLPLNALQQTHRYVEVEADTRSQIVSVVYLSHSFTLYIIERTLSVTWSMTHGNMVNEDHFPTPGDCFVFAVASFNQTATYCLSLCITRKLIYLAWATRNIMEILKLVSLYIHQILLEIWTKHRVYSHF